MTQSSTGDESIRAALTRIVQRVAELPDRTSPDDWPEAMLVTGAELEQILGEELSALLARLLGTPQSEWSVEKAARTVLETFERDEAQGYRSRDRQFAIRLLKAALTEPPPPEKE